MTHLVQLRRMSMSLLPRSKGTSLLRERLMAMLSGECCDDGGSDGLL
jgi:hypothetical protein